MRITIQCEHSTRTIQFAGDRVHEDIAQARVRAVLLGCPHCAMTMDNYLPQYSYSTVDPAKTEAS